MTIYDIILFNNEIDLLKLRCKMYLDIPDYVIILIESTRTFTNNVKPLWFNENKHMFDEYKIIHLIYDNTEELDPLNREFQQRNFATNTLKQICNPTDILIQQDADEFVNPELIKHIINKKIMPPIMCKVHFFYYSAKWCRKNDWDGAFIFFPEALNHFSLQQLRNHRHDLGIHIDNAGWHFSYFHTVENIMDKIKSFSHQELNILEINNETYLQKCIDSGKSYHCDEQFQKNTDVELPQYFNEIMPEFLQNIDNTKTKKTKKNLNIFYYDKNIYEIITQNTLKYEPENINTKQLVSVIIDPRGDQNMKNSINYHMHFLKKYDLFIFTHESKVNDLKMEHKNANVISIPNYFFHETTNNFTIKEYNSFLMSKILWRKLQEYKFALIFQSDSILYKEPIFDYSYSMIGGPFYSQNDVTPQGNGLCGGLSLRNINDMYECVSNISWDDIYEYRSYKPINCENEDVFFTHALEILKKPIPSRNVCIDNIVEIDIPNENTWGYHGWNKYYHNNEIAISKLEESDYWITKLSSSI